ncbi:hypothetical protein PPACK8108_LOCUS25252 [Phakopsora pachyrhizi]|uniref:Uncharacterized protein n=1 Tax=Phakopsora pachyrhizi TaxID=170000 RepID=A0AAV0BTB6_PHAPC|nr:hypothetical protein PPACK8108_LOCUS25252 [Phakopsora pachyrhizi]
MKHEGRKKWLGWIEMGVKRVTLQRVLRELKHNRTNKFNKDLRGLNMDDLNCQAEDNEDADSDEINLTMMNAYRVTINVAGSLVAVIMIGRPNSPMELGLCFIPFAMFMVWILMARIIPDRFKELAGIVGVGVKQKAHTKLLQHFGSEGGWESQTEAKGQYSWRKGKEGVSASVVVGAAGYNSSLAIGGENLEWKVSVLSYQWSRQGLKATHKGMDLVNGGWR